MKLAPSILSADFGNLQQEAAAVVEAGADWLHIDVMDGHFVPNITIGPCVVASLRKNLSVFFDVHLMISDPLFYAEAFAKAGADLICFHLEATQNPAAVIQKIRSLGKQVGISIKPGTPAEQLFPYLQDIDLVLVMTVEPGFGGQAFQANQMQKVQALRCKIDENQYSVLIEVDGGIDATTIGLAAQSGVDVAVAGSAVYGKPNYAQALRALRQGAQPEA